MTEEEMLRQVVALGAYKAAVIDVKDVRFDRGFRSLCEANTCGNYGRNWMCPPDAGDIDELMERARSFDRILVYQTVGELEDSYDFEGMMEAGKAHGQLDQRISDWARGLGFSRCLQLGAGGCRVCEVCARRTNEPCRHPDRAMASLETYGIAVSELAATCGMKYINGQNTVTYFGGLLFCR